MKMKERIVAVLHHEKPDVIPFTVYTMLLPSRGSGERDLRNMGLGLVELGLSVYGVKTPNVKMQTTEDLALFLRGYRITSTSRQKRLAQRAYTSPAGTVSEKYTLGYTPGLGEWPVEWMIKDLRDYEIVGYMIDDTEYFPDYEEFSKAEEILGDDGIVIPMTPKSPLQSMLLDLMGYERFSIDYQNHRHEIDALYTLFTKKQLEMYKVIADSPAEVILLDDNINGIVTNPKLFERYCMPFYEKVAEIFHQHDKILMVHCDGKLKCLRTHREKQNGCYRSIHSTTHRRYLNRRSNVRLERENPVGEFSRNIHSGSTTRSGGRRDDEYSEECFTRRRLRFRSYGGYR